MTVMSRRTCALTVNPKFLSFSCLVVLRLVSIVTSKLLMLIDPFILRHLLWNALYTLTSFLCSQTLSSFNAGAEATVSHSASPQQDKPSATLQSPANPASIAAFASAASDVDQHQRPADGADVAPDNRSLSASPHAMPSLAYDHRAEQGGVNSLADPQASERTLLLSRHMSLLPSGEHPASHAVISAQKDAADAAPETVPHSSEVDTLGSSGAAPGCDRVATAGQPTAAASALAPGNGKLVLMAAKNMAPADDICHPTQEGTQAEEAAPLRAEQHEAAPAAQQIYASGFTTGTGKQVSMTAKGKAKADQLPAGHAAAAQAEPEAITTGFAQVPLTGSKSKSPGSLAPNAPAVEPVASGFTTGTGKAVTVSAAALAEARKLLQQESSVGQHPAEDPPAAPGQDSAEAPPVAVPAAAASGFTSGTGKANQPSAAAQAHAQQLLGGDSTAAQTAAVAEPTPAGMPAASGFTTGTGRKVQPSAAAQCRAKQLLEGGSTAVQTEAVAEPRPVGVSAASGFTTGTGRKVQPSTAAQARAKQLLEGASNGAQKSAKADSLPVSTAAATASGFTSGTGKAVLLSAAAQAKARDLLNDENTAPKHPTAPPASAAAGATADADAVSTPAGVRKAEGKGTGVRPVLGTPRTGPTAAKPLLKRVQELSKSTGGKLFKKPRMSKIMTPVCPGVTPNRVMLC